MLYHIVGNTLHGFRTGTQPDRLEHSCLGRVVRVVVVHLCEMRPSKPEGSSYGPVRVDGIMDSLCCSRFVCVPFRTSMESSRSIETHGRHHSFRDRFALEHWLIRELYLLSLLGSRCRSTLAQSGQADIACVSCDFSLHDAKRHRDLRPHLLDSRCGSLRCCDVALH